jgi:hypothetical protein
MPEVDDRLIAWLGHELQHAVEISHAPEAQRVQTRVKAEIARLLPKP